MKEEPSPSPPWLEVAENEWETVLEPRRREQATRFPRDEKWFQDRKNLFGIALSGGGIRAATISLGFLEVLNHFGLLRKADYLSTVSGGGFLGGYVHAKLQETRDREDPFAELLGRKERERIREHRKYLLAPGGLLKRAFMRMRLATAFGVSLLMNSLWIAALAAMIGILSTCLDKLVPDPQLQDASRALSAVILLVMLWHFFGHPLRHRLRIWSSELFYTIETILFVALALCLFPLVRPGEPSIEFSKLGFWLLASVVVLVVTGFFGNPNVLTMHRYYRDRLAVAFLRTAGSNSMRLRLSELANGHDAPYPLINTCLNLRIEHRDHWKASNNEEVRGGLSSDFFLLSPLRCGSSLTGYASTTIPPYSHLPLATAVAASGAALNPAMGVGTSRLRAFFMTLLNLRLGYWVHNPAKIGRFHRIHWWPWYHLQDLLATFSLRGRRVSISDGGHIENLGIFELLRRRCRLIIALDAGADPDFHFNDLENLVRRAREQLGVVIDFGRLDPVELIRPSPSKGYSDSQFVVGRIGTLKGSRLEGYSGLLLYVKSSLRAQRTFHFDAPWSHDYKRHHPAFPHESTANQFFDSLQWQAYYRLGFFMAGDLLAENIRKAEEVGGRDRSVSEVFESWDAIRFKKDLKNWLGGADKELPSVAR